MSPVWAIAWRDLRGSKAGLRLLALCLFLGVATLAGVGSLTAAILGELSSRGQVILGGDIEMETAQRRASSTELAAFRQAGATSETIRMRAMAARADGSQSVLAELKGVDTAYPLYGQFRLATGASMARPAGQTVAIAPALGEKLGVGVGDTIRIGEAALRVIGIIADEPDRVGEGFTLGPVAIVDLDALAQTALIQPGSLYTTKYRIKTPNGADPARIGVRLSNRFPGAGWEVQDRSNGAPGTRRFFERLGQFLALVGLTALVVAGIGVGNGVASWLDGKRGGIATLKVLGASSATIFRTYLAQIAIIAVVATMAGLVTGALFPVLVVRLAGELLPVAPAFALYPAPLVTAAAYGALVALLFSIAPLARARAVAAATLFRGGVETADKPTVPVMLAITGVAIAIAILAIATAREPRFAAIFVGCAVALLIVLTGLGWLVRTLAARLPRPTNPLARLALANLHRPGSQTGRLVVALGLGLTLFSTLAFIQTSFQSAIDKTIPARAPSYFALDIPKEDEARFRKSVLAAAPGADIRLVPTLRGPVVALGDKRVSEMRDLPPDAWFLRGDRGLTFARDLPEGSRITAGKWWPADYAGPPLLSIDERAAKAVGLKIGDKLTVSVLGVEVEARIASFREIDWDTMGFNFVLVFSPGTLEGAPFTLSATIAVPAGDEARIARAVSMDFPAVSMIRIKDVIVQVSTLLRQMAAAISVAAGVAVLAGIAVLVGAVSAARRRRDYDAVLLKLLGATRRQVLAVQAIEYAALATILSLLALAIGAVAGWIVMTRVFEFGWSPDWAIVLGTVLLGGLGTLALGLLGSLPALAARPAQALRAL